MQDPPPMADEFGLLGEPLPCNEGLKTLVVDLDETLVHSVFHKPKHFDILLPVHLDPKEYLVYVLLRPGYREFLEELSQHYELVIYTASLAQYADPLMDIIDPNGLCTRRLFREHCTNEGGVYVKDLSQLGRPLSSVLLLDNSANSYKY